MNLKKIRKLRGISQQGLADYLGVSKQMVSMWENNLNEKIPEKRVKQIADYLRVPSDMLFTEDLDMNIIELYNLQDELEGLQKRYERLNYLDEYKNDAIYSEMTDFFARKDSNESKFDDQFIDEEKLEMAFKFLKSLKYDEITVNRERLLHLFIEVYSIKDERIIDFSVELLKLILLAAKGDLMAEDRLHFVEQIIQIDVK